MRRQEGSGIASSLGDSQFFSEAAGMTVRNRTCPCLIRAPGDELSLFSAKIGSRTHGPLGRSTPPGTVGERRPLTRRRRPLTRVQWSVVDTNLSHGASLGGSTGGGGTWPQRQASQLQPCGKQVYQLRFIDERSERPFKEKTAWAFSRAAFKVFLLPLQFPTSVCERET